MSVRQEQCIHETVTQRSGIAIAALHQTAIFQLTCSCVHFVCRGWSRSFIWVCVLEGALFLVLSTGLLKSHILQPFETCCFFNTKIKGNHHLQVAMFRCFSCKDPCSMEKPRELDPAISRVPRVEKRCFVHVADPRLACGRGWQLSNSKCRACSGKCN